MAILTISGIELGQLRNSEFIQLQTDILTITQANDPVALKVKPQHDALAAKMAEIDPLYKMEQGSLLTPTVESADMRRDKAINGILANVDSFTYHFQPDKVTAALSLKHSLDNYGTGIARQNMTSETAILTNLADDWKTKPLLLNSVDKLELKEWLDELDAANKAFNVVYLERNKETAGNPTESLKEKRLEANELYYLLRDKLLAHANVNDFINPWAQTINEWEALLASYNQIIINRAADNAAAPDAPATPDAPPANP